jgi:serine/threonine protein phosphatase PrpC
MASSRITISMGSATDIGGYAENQDATCILPSSTGVLAAVFDGHGPYGRHIAEWATEWLSAHPDAPLTALTFSEIDEHIRQRLIALLTGVGIPHVVERRALYHSSLFGGRGGPVRGGTTATLTRVDPATGAVEVAHVGDSEVRVFDIKRGTGEWVTQEGVGLCADHSPTSREETERIRRSHPGARSICDPSTDAEAAVERPVWVRGALNPAGPFKVCDVRGAWGTYLRAADDSEGLAVTRALGDFNLQRMGGVSTVPSIASLPPLSLTPSVVARYVVLGSDGFWDMVHYAEVSEVIGEAITATADTHALAATLVDLAKRKTVERIGAVGDNISVVVIRVECNPSA